MIFSFLFLSFGIIFCAADKIEDGRFHAAFNTDHSLRRAVQTTEKRFILRLDAVQDYYLSTTQQSILNYLMDRNIPVSAGIIGGFFTGADTALYSVLKKCVSLGKDNCMLANSGMDAKYLFNNATSAVEASAPVQNGDNQIRRLFPGYTTDMMQPYQGYYNSYLLTALNNLGFYVISGETANANPSRNMMWDLTARPLQMPKHTSTALVNSTGQVVGQSVATIVSDCDNVVAIGQICVVSLNPVEFSNGQFSLQKLGILLDTLAGTGYSALTFHKVITEVFGLPDTVMPTVQPTVAPRGRFILRLDDVQDYYLSTTQRSILNYLMNRNIPVSAGIIGGYFTGADTALYAVLKKCVSLGKDNCMLANSGMDTLFLFQNATSVVEAAAPVQNADNQIRRLFPGYMTDMMQPYHGSYNAYLLTALNNLGVYAVSGTTLASSHTTTMRWDLTTRPLQMPIHTSTAAINSTTARSVAAIVSDCTTNAIVFGQPCVIALNPVEFSTGHFDLTKLGTLIDTLTEHGHTPITFHQVIVDVLGLPNTQMPTMQPTGTPPRRFVIRVDDIQDWYITGSQQTVINYLLDRNVAVSPGIIGGFFNGADPGIYKTLKRCISRGPNKCNLCNHGMNASFVFGQQTSVEAVKTPIQQCDEKIRKVFPGYVPFMFTPHQNSWNPYLLTALQELGYLGVSASSDLYSNSMTWDTTTRPIQMPAQTTTATRSINQTVADCDAVTFFGQVCVIMIHPMEFASGQYNVTMLGALIDTLFRKGYTDTTFYTIIAETMHWTHVPTAAPTPWKIRYDLTMSLDRVTASKVSTQGAKAMEETVNHFLASPATNSFRGVVNGTLYGTSWKLFVQNLLTIPLSGPYARFTGNETGLYHVLQGMIISSVRSGSFATYLRTRAQVNNATEFFNVTASGVRLSRGGVFLNSTETDVSNSSDKRFWLLTTSGIVTMSIAGVVCVITGMFLYARLLACEPKAVSKAKEEVFFGGWCGCGSSSWWWLKESTTSLYAKEFAPTMDDEVLDIADTGTTDMDDRVGSNDQEEEQYEEEQPSHGGDLLVSKVET